MVGEDVEAKAEQQKKKEIGKPFSKTETLENFYGHKPQLN
jgi:hypothetical protein